MNLINQLIPADDLHWSEEDKKYLPLSDEELDSIIINCATMLDEDELVEAVRWAESARISQILLNHLIKGNLTIFQLDPKNGPHFVRKDILDEYLENLR